MKSKGYKRTGLTIPQLHQLKIARRTLELSDFGVMVLGGMTKSEARAIILRLTGKRAIELD